MIDPAEPDYAWTPASRLRPRFGYTLADPAASPCVSIVTPFYNTGEIFHETARSVMAQSLQQWEWLIVNDASTDPQALGVLNRYRSGDSRVRILDFAENRGPGASRNAAIQLARSPWIALLDSDDLLEPTALEKWLWFLVSYPAYAFVKGYTVGFGASQYLWKEGFHSGMDFLSDNRVDTSSLVRKWVHDQIGGFDEAVRDGLEDWEYWLHCASAGYWGGTVPEFLNWYRRRPTHHDRWANWDLGERQNRFRSMLRQRYPGLWQGGFPEPPGREMLPNEAVPDELPCENRLSKDRPRLLMVVPWLATGGADKFNLDLVQQLTDRGWEVTLAATLESDHEWLPQFSRYTPDIFILNHFLHLADQPRFLRYLIASRQIDVVMVSNSEMGYLLLPYLRALFPDVTFVDYCHLEEVYWKNGGYPRLAIEYQEQLDLNLVASQHLRNWMIGRGAKADQIRVCHINVDPETWFPDPALRAAVRRDLGLEQEEPVILFAGRIVAQKQPQVLAKTLQALHQANQRFTALIAGDGPDLKWLRSFLRQNRLEGAVRLLGLVSSARIRGLMAAADVLFLPSGWEGIALVFYEAMACGLPVVGADVGGQRELVTPDCGVLLEPSDEATQVRLYAQTLADLLANPEKRQAMGQAARQRICTNFPLNRMGDQMISLLAEARERHNASLSPAPSQGLGRATAAQAVEYIRLSRLADELWAARTQTLGASVPQKKYNWRARLFAWLYHWHEPIYRWYSARGLDWISPLRERIKRLLLR